MYLLMTSLKKATSYFGSFLFYYFYYFIFLFLFVFILNLPALKALIRIFFLILWGKRSLVNIFDMQRFHKTKCLLMNSLICFTPCRNECYILVLSPLVYSFNQMSLPFYVIFCLLSLLYLSQQTHQNCNHVLFMFTNIVPNIEPVWNKYTRNIY